MKSILPFLAVVLCGAAAAWLVFRDETREPADVGASDEAIVLDDPLFYRDLEPQRRLAAARERLATMATTAIAATEAGPTKDELALLARSEDVVDLIVDRFHDRRGEAETSAFMEIFARLRHPRFGPLVVEGLKGEGYEVLSNAVRAAEVQRHPATVPALATLLDRPLEIGRTAVVAALGAVGTQDALAAITARIDELERDAVIEALLVLAAVGYTEAIPAVRELANAEDVGLRVVALGTLARFGLGEGGRGLVAIARDPRVEMEARAQALQILGDVGAAGARDVALELANSDDPFLAAESRLMLARAGDENLLAALRTDVAAGDAGARLAAVSILASSGRAEDLAFLAERFDRLATLERHAVLRGLAVGRAPGAAAFLGDVARSGTIPWATAIQALAALREDATAELARMTRELEPGDDRIDAVIVALVDAPSEDALAALEAVTTTDRRTWINLRRAIRRVELELGRR